MSLPPLGVLRLAAPVDLLRIGVVAACGFRYSPVFDWERPHHERFPQDTLLSYRQEFEQAMRSPEHAVLVAVDRYQANEASKSKAIIPPDDALMPPAEGDEVVVGVACWKVEQGSKRRGTFQNDRGEYPTLGENRNRDRDLDHTKRFGDAAEAAEKRYFHNYASMEMVVVHPAYWGRGHGESLVRWGMALATADSVKQGVIAAKMGVMLYERLGWKKVSDICLDGDDIMPEGLEVAVMEYDATVTG